MKRHWALLFLIPILASACAFPFVQACRDTARDPDGNFKFTERQAAVACSSREVQAYAYPHFLLHDKENGNDKWELNLSGVLTSDVKEVMLDQAKSLDRMLSYKNRDWADEIDWFKNFRKGLEKEELVVLEILRRLNYVETYNKFVDEAGELPDQMKPKELSYFFAAGRKFYSMRILYPARRLTDIPFTAEYLEVAKRDGTLKLVDTFDLNSSQLYAKKVVNLYDPNDFKWEKQDRGWRIISYKVMSGLEKPADNVVHYIEIYRKKKDPNDFEKNAAVKGFLAAGGQKVAVFVVDYDREGMHGYGSPDEMIKTFGDLTTGADIFADSTLREKLLLSLYDSPRTNPQDKPERKKPQDRQVYTAIVKMGDAKVDLWEQGTWSVPFDYKTLSQNLEIAYKPPMSPEEKRLEERDKVKKIHFFRREFKQDGKVVVMEYWAPKGEYAGRNITYTLAMSDTLKLRRKGGVEEVGEVAYFGKLIVSIRYLYGGKWFEIVDEDGNGTFEKKREISDPTVSPNATPAVSGYGGPY